MNLFFLGLKSIVPWIFLTFFITKVFSFNLLGAADSDFKDAWQRDSEVLVSLGVAANRAGSIEGNYGLATGLETAYNAQIGFPGYFARLWMGIFGSEDIQLVQTINVWFFSAVFSLLLILLYKKTTVLVSFTFMLSIILSPWMVAASNNAYWLLWTWFLPPVFAVLWTTENNSKRKIIWIFALFISFAIRFASGYEFVTSLILAAVLMPIFINASVKIQDGSVKHSLYQALQILGVGIFSFFIVLTTHSFIRGGGNAYLGIKDIVKNDVLRRTYGNPELFDEFATPSLTATPIDVLNQYFFHWKTNLIQTNIPGPLGISLPGVALFILTMAAVAIVLNRLYSKDLLWKKDLLLFIVAFSIPMSWFILGKSHSFAHPHVDFILWYVFYLGAIIFICLRWAFEHSANKKVPKN